MPLAQRLDNPRAVRWVVLFLIFCIFLWPGYGELKVSGLPNVAPPRLIKTLLFLLLAYRFLNVGIELRRVGERISQHWVLFGILFFYHLLLILSFALDQASMVLIYGYVKEEVFTNLLLMFAVIFVVRDDDDIKSIVKALVLASIGVALIAATESFVKVNLFKSVVSNVNTALAFGDKTRDLRYRANGTFSHPLVLAQYAAVMLPLAWWLFSQPSRKKIIWLIALVGLVTCSILSVTRSGLVLLIVSAIAITLVSATRWWYRCKNGVLKMLLLTQAIGWGFLVIFSVSGWITRLIEGTTREESNSSFYRLEVLRSAIPKILSSPLIGYGPTHAMEGVGVGRMGNIIDNYFLLVGLESGIFAAMLLLVLFVVAAKTAWHKFSLKRGISIHHMLAISSVIFCMFLLFVHALPELLPLFYIFLGLIVSATKNKKSSIALSNPL